MRPNGKSPVQNGQICAWAAGQATCNVRPIRLTARNIVEIIVFLN